MSQPFRLGVYGGAFDPPHLAHVALARTALHQLELDELRIFPTGQAWHKARALTAAEHRLAMVQLAFGALADTVVDARELQRSGPTYTIDTLRELRAEMPQASVQWVADAAVAPGGCLVDAAGTVVNGSLEKRWQRAIAPLGLAAAWEPELAAGGDDDGI